MRPPMDPAYIDLLMELETNGPDLFSGITCEALAAWQAGHLDRFPTLAWALYILVQTYAHEHGHDLIVLEGERID